MEKFTSEVLPNSLVEVRLREDGEGVNLYCAGDFKVALSVSCINRLHGIAFPEVRRTGCCHIETDEIESDSSYDDRQESDIIEARRLIGLE